MGLISRVSSRTYRVVVYHKYKSYKKIMLRRSVTHLSRKSAAATIPKKFKTPDRLNDSYVGADSIWVEMAGMTIKHQALNLGQGFPNFFPPSHVIENLSQTDENYLLNQYTRGPGHPKLVKALADMYSPLLDRELDPNSNIIVTVGAYASLYSAIVGNVEVGDEVIIIEPFFDCYAPMVRLAGGTPKFVTLKPPSCPKAAEDTANWYVDMDEYKALFNEKTKAVVINNPHNPSGKVFSYDELNELCDVIKENDCLAIADEVYEHLLFEDNKTHRIATLPDMWDRTFTIGSAGKTFSVTGWKLGWCIAPEYLIKNMGYVWQNVVYTSPTPIQEACANSFNIEMALEKAGNKKDCYFYSLADELYPKRDQMADLLRQIGLKPVIPQGGYFMMAEASELDVKIPEEFYDDKVPWDHNLARYLCEEKKLSVIPNSAFYSLDSKFKEPNNKYLRFCFAKNDDTFKATEELFKKNF